ncbi:MAG: MATE family efflux transporter [Pseudomonadota bacterium]
MTQSDIASDTVSEQASGTRVTEPRAMPTPFALKPEAFGERLRRHLSLLMRLAWPVMLSRAGILLMAFADIAMLGHFAVGAAGEMTLGLAVFVPVIVFTIGLASGSVPVIAQAHGRGDRRETGRAWRRAMIFATVASTIGAVIVAFGGALLGAVGQTPEMATAGGRVALMLAPGVVAQVLFAICAFYLEATNRPLPALWVMAGVNIANVALNAVLIDGGFGLDAMGAPGAALATTIVRWGAVIAMMTVILTQHDALGAGVLDARIEGQKRASFWGPGGWRAGAMMRRLGLSAGLSNGFETAGFAALSLIAGQLGRLPLDAYGISHNIVSTIFMVGLGLAIATGVRVGQETGRGQPHEAAFAGWVGVGASLLVMGSIALAVFAARPAIVAIYTGDPELAAATIALLAFSVLIFVPDCLQVVVGQALRALGDAWVAIAIYALAFAVLLIPLGYWLATAAGMGVAGLALAITVTCLLAFVLLSWRFRVLTRRNTSP